MSSRRLRRRTNWKISRIRLNCLAALLRTMNSIKKTIPTGFRILVVHADTQEEKMWTPQLFAKAIDAVLDYFSGLVVLIVGYNPSILIGGPHASRIIPCFGLPFANSCGIVKGAHLFLGVDSCMLHVADFSLVPSVGLFGCNRCT